MAFATAEDVATRLGRSFTDAELGMAEFLAEAATAVIADAAGKTDAWADALDPVPRILRFVVVEIVVRALSNPEGLGMDREQLGAYAYTRNFRAVAEGGGLILSTHEVLLVRRAVYGRTSASVKVESVADELYGS